MAKRPATKAEKAHLDRVASLGCIICRNEGQGYAPALVHHIRTGMGMRQRNSHFNVMPLCPRHHQTGGFGVAFHSGSREWQKIHGSELDLLAQVQSLLEAVA